MAQKGVHKSLWLPDQDYETLEEIRRALGGSVSTNSIIRMALRALHDLIRAGLWPAPVEKLKYCQKLLTHAGQE